MVSYEDRKNMTFEQAEGFGDLPGPLALGELNQKFRSYLWAILYCEIEASENRFKITGYMGKILWRYYVTHKLLPADEWKGNFHDVASDLKRLIMNGPYYEVLGFVQFLIRDDTMPYNVADLIIDFVNTSSIAYRVVCGDPPTIIPAVTEEEGDAIKGALEGAASQGLFGVQAHLMQAAKNLNEEDFASSVRESIHSVESVAKNISVDANAELGPALEELAKHTNIHRALKKGFKSIYGYSSDEKGIRHALLDQQAQVDQHDAVFMLGACASFVTYLINKAHDNGLLDR